MENVKTKPNYYKIDISLEQALREGRLDEKSVDEARGKPFFKEFYLCQFPEEDEIDAKGYRQLVVMDDITQATIDAVVTSELPMKMGVDIGAGGDYNVFCIRQGNQAWFEAWNRSNDTMTNVNEVIRIIDKYTITKTNPLTGKQHQARPLKPEDVYIDDIGVGRGPSDRLKEMSAEVNGVKLTYHVNGVSVGEKPQDPTKYKNIKAENYWLAAERVKGRDGKGVLVNRVVRDERWQQLTWIKYKISTDKVLQIEPKQNLKDRENKSPDFAESFMLCFSVGKPQPGIRLL